MGALGAGAGPTYSLQCLMNIPANTIAGDAGMSSLHWDLQLKGHFIGCCWGLGCGSCPREWSLCEADDDCGFGASVIKTFWCTAMEVFTRADKRVSLSLTNKKQNWSQIVHQKNSGEQARASERMRQHAASLRRYSGGTRIRSADCDPAVSAVYNWSSCKESLCHHASDALSVSGTHPHIHTNRNSPPAKHHLQLQSSRIRPCYRIEPDPDHEHDANSYFRCSPRMGRKCHTSKWLTFYSLYIYIYICLCTIYIYIQLNKLKQCVTVGKREKCTASA